MAGSARDEAERLVATILAMAGGGDQNPTPDGTREQTRSAAGLGDSLAGMIGGLASGRGWSTGSAECCVCPVCRAIAAVRDPSPEATERVATGAGDIAMGMASLLRGFSAMTRSRPAPRPAPARAPRPTDPGETWSAATRRADAAHTDADAVHAGPATTGTPPTGTTTPAATISPAGTGNVTTSPMKTVGANTSPAGADRGPGEPGADAWSAATTASAAAAEAAAAERRAAAQRAAAQAATARAAAAAERVAQAVALAEAARAANAATTAGDATTAGGAATGRTVGGFDVWAAATAGEGQGRSDGRMTGVADVAAPATMDHDVPGASAPGDRGGAAGDEARGGDPV